MKKIKFSGFAVLFLFVFANQFVWGDILIRKDDPNPPTQPNNVTSMSSMTRIKASSSTSSSNFIPITADVVGSELIVDFTTTIGTAYVSVVDDGGNVVYQTVVDTFSTSEVAIPVDGMGSGKYSLKISYGSTRLIGDFRL
jgi:hypothetical protein